MVSIGRCILCGSWTLNWLGGTPELDTVVGGIGKSVSRRKLAGVKVFHSRPSNINSGPDGTMPTSPWLIGVRYEADVVWRVAGRVCVDKQVKAVM